MGFLSDILAWVSNFAIQTISSLGYFGVFFLMVLESMIIPLPSELVMPFAGFLIAKGTFSWPMVIVASTLGSLIGSLISYYIGQYGGYKVINRYGHLLLLDREDLKKTEQWFKKRGEKTIFFGRLIPVVRHIISIPAGMGRMNMKKFMLYTVLGAALWNSFLAYLGYVLGQNWEKVKVYSEPLSIVVLALLVAAAVYFVYKHVKRKKNKK